MKEIKKLKHSEPHKFKRKASEDQYKFNLKLGESLPRKSPRLEKLNRNYRKERNF